EFNGGRPDAKIIRIQSRSDERCQMRSELEMGVPPMFYAPCNLVISTVVVIDSTLQEKLGLLLCRLPIQTLDLVLRHDGRRCGLRLTLQREIFRKLLPGGARGATCNKGKCTKNAGCDGGNRTQTPELRIYSLPGANIGTRD